MSLISEDQKSVYQSAIKLVHDTMKRPLYVYKNPKKTIVSSVEQNKNHNSLFGDDQYSEEQVKYTPVSGIFYGRILYEDNFTSNELLNFNKSIPDKVQENFIRIKIDEEGYDFIKDSKKINIDGQNCEITTTDRRHGLFNPEYRTLWLRRIK